MGVAAKGTCEKVVMSRQVGVPCQEHVEVALKGDAEPASDSLRGVLHELASADLAASGSGEASSTGTTYINKFLLMTRHKFANNFQDTQFEKVNEHSTKCEIVVEGIHESAKVVKALTSAHTS